MANLNDVELLAETLRRSIGSEATESFDDALEGNDYDYETVTQALNVFLSRLHPDDWKSDDFGTARVAMWGYIAKDTREANEIAATMRKWISNPEWKHQTHFLDFAKDVVQTIETWN